MTSPLRSCAGYTIDAGERDNAIANLGCVDQGIAGYVWLTP